MAYAALPSVNTGDIGASAWANQVKDNDAYLKSAADAAATAAQLASVNQGVLTGSRSLNVTYHNSSGKIVIATVTVRVVDSGGGSTAWAYCAAGSNPNTLVGQMYANASANVDMPVTLVVPPGYYYLISGGRSVVSWIEWTLF